ncbi:hypothetical protein [Ornithinimicrobium kibberense]|uniref:hypothetical protein n=1 Tax=Ornithinimicrobium kibberense TaxID=282060 RepID=UPI003619BDFD
MSWSSGSAREWWPSTMRTSPLSAVTRSAAACSWSDSTTASTPSRSWTTCSRSPRRREWSSTGPRSNAPESFRSWTS